MPQDEHVGRVQSVVASAKEGLSAFSASWRRSLLNYKLDPATIGLSRLLPSARLREKREASGSLRAVAGPVLDRLSAAVSAGRCAVMLTDATGLVVEDRLRTEDRTSFHGMNLRSGADWSEQSEGTNGIGTCIAEARPVTVWRDQHFRAPHCGLRCSGAPIFGPDGALVGALDISSVREDMPDCWAQILALSVQDAARRIEADLFQQHFSKARILATGDEGALLALDRDDLIIGATRAARRRFGLGEGVLMPRPAADVLLDQGSSLDGAQRAVLAQALARTGGNVAAAARTLGIGRATFYRKAKALGLGL